MTAHPDIAVAGLSFTIAIAGLFAIAALWFEDWVERARDDLLARMIKAEDPREASR